MVRVSNDGNVVINRGDTVNFLLFINKGTEMQPLRYIPQEGDTIFVGITEPNQPFECAILKQKYTNANLNADGDVVIKLTPKDTECLKPGKYFYEIKLKFANEEVNTIIPQRQFNIEE